MTRNVLDNRPNISTTAKLSQNGLEIAKGINDTTAVKLVAISGRKRSAKALWAASTAPIPSLRAWLAASVSNIVFFKLKPIRAKET